MIIKRYLVKDMNEAMAKIRYELGKDAIIVSNRWIRQRGITNFFKRKVLEVTAAVDRKKPEEPLLRESREMGVVKEEAARYEYHHVDKYQKELDELKALVYQLLEDKQEISTQSINAGEGLREERQKNYGGISKEKSSEGSITQLFESLEIDEEVIEGFTAYCMENKIFTNINSEVFKCYIEDFIENIGIGNVNIGRGILAFIGPTGVGKTTTIAKIAARESINHGKKVGLITLDTYRIGAVEQLKTYANILNIPIETVLTKSDLKLAIEKLSYCDIILIDSTGRSSYNTEQLRETKELLDGIEEKKNILVVGTNLRRKDLKSIIHHYREVGFDYIIMTKVDETECHGNILNVSYYAKKPLLYITTGQNVPDDILVASKENILDYLFKEGEYQWIKRKV